MPHTRCKYSVAFDMDNLQAPGKLRCMIDGRPLIDSTVIVCHSR